MASAIVDTNGRPGEPSTEPGIGSGAHLVIATILPLEGSTGVHTHVLQFQQFLLRNGMEAAVTTPFSWGGPLAVAAFGPRVILERLNRSMSVAWYRYWHEVFLFRALRKRLAGLVDAIVYAQGPEAAKAALRARSGSHQRVVMAVHFQESQAQGWVERGSIKVDGAVNRRIRRFEREVIPKVDGIVYVSRSAREGLLRWVPDAAAVPSEVIPNFLYASATPSQAPRRDLVSVGSLLPAKNHRFLLEVVAEARRQGRLVDLDIYGDGPCRRDLTRLITSLGVEDQVRLMGFDPHVQKRLARYRAYVHSSYTESFSIAIVEAMAAGLPVFAASTGGIPELVDDGAEGRFWQLEDPRKAAMILIEVLDDPTALAEMGQASKMRFRGNFDAELVGPRLCEFLLERPRPPERPVDGLGVGIAT